ncbi:MAG TPA: cold shock domain-containing protein [Candidatus Paceibacterota bacterium]|nr:cold shock domain-containing protein [Candidatus Paceibacterota bacterium]
MQRGIIKHLNFEKGFGFIRVENGPDVFFHASQRHPDELGQPARDREIFFELRQGQKGPVAWQWRLTPPQTPEIDPECDRREGYRPGIMVALRWSGYYFVGQRRGSWAVLMDMMSDPLLEEIRKQTELPIESEADLLAALERPPHPDASKRIDELWTKELNRPDWEFAYGVPQGGIEPGEHWEDAIRRELEEELGDYRKMFGEAQSWSDAIKGQPTFLFKERSNFRVEKDGRVYRGKALYAFLVELNFIPDWVDTMIFGSRGDEHNSFPCPEFENGGEFCDPNEAIQLIRATHKGAKGDQLVRLFEMAKAA